MPDHQYFAKKLLTLIVMPVLISLALMIACFYHFQTKQGRVYETQLLRVVDSALATPLKNQIKPTQNVLDAILQIDGISFLTLINTSEQTTLHYGLPLRLKDYSWLTTAPSENSIIFRKDSILYKGIRIQEHQWLIAGVSYQSLLLDEYKNFFLVVFIGLVALGVIAISATKLHNTVIAPLRMLVIQAGKLLTQQSDNPIQVISPSLYADVANIINEMARYQKGMQEEIQGSGEQATHELRETLETVEIQNIELDLARKNALKASKAKSEFLANTSHELRTPLNGILGFTSLLHKTALTNQQRDYLATIEQSSQGLLTVINDILDFSKLETGQLTLEYKPVVLNELIEEIFSIYAPQAHEKNLRLLSIIQRSAQLPLLGDPSRIRQVISNLVINAIKFSNRGNIVLKATSLSETDNQTEIKITISDNGIGLTEEQQTHLFDAFSKVDSSDSRIQGGAGLGLAIAKGLINRMQGEIGVDSKPNSGSHFWFTIRLGLDKAQSQTPALHNSLYGINALAYDSNPESLSEISHHLEEWGIFYLEESNLVDIEKPLAETRNKSGFDIVILDTYTDLNSFDKDKLLRIIHNINARYQLPIIVLAPSSIQRLLQDDILGLNTILVTRPLIQKQFHQALCNQLNIVQPLCAPENTNTTNHSLTSPILSTHALVVDDNPANLKLVGEFLKGLGVQVTQCDNGYDAVNSCKNSQFDLIFMDVQMPGIDGLETTRQLREQEGTQRTPIIALTAHAVDEQKTRLLLAGMDDYLSKPVSEADLQLMIDRWHTSSFAAPQTPEAFNKTPLTQNVPAASPSTITPDHIAETKLSVFDWNESMTLAKNKPDLAKDMLKMLVKSIMPTRNELEHAYQEQNWPALTEITHKFHGGCCYCGVPLLRHASKSLENVLNKKDEAQYAQKVAELIQQMTALEQWLEEYDLDSLFTE